MAITSTTLHPGQITPNRIRKQTQLRDSLIYNSVKNIGLLQPIHVTKDNVLVDGHARLSAALRLDVDEIECEVHDITEIEAVELAMALNGYPADILASTVFSYPKIFPKWEKLSEAQKEKHVKLGHTLSNLNASNRPVPKLRTSANRNPFLPYSQLLPIELQNRLKHILSRPLTREQAATLLTLFNENHDINNAPKKIIDQMTKGPQTIFAKSFP
jgi:hypothetical protein